jgi:hypothetical protein
METTEQYYFSFVTREFEPECDYQLHIIDYKTENGDIIRVSEFIQVNIEGAIEGAFFNKLWKFAYKEIKDYIHYHYENFKGKRIDFLDHLRDILLETIDSFDSDNIKKRVSFENNNKYISNRRKTIKALEIIEDELKRIKSFDNILNEIQINKTIEAKKDKSKEETPCPQMFKDGAFELFEELMKKLKSKRDLSFIYRRMEKDGYIYPNLKQEVFIDFLYRQYGDSIEKIITLNECTDKYGRKEEIYSLTKLQLKLN